jgi:threonine synthase
VSGDYLPIGESGDIQERQLTTLGQNIKALEVDMFDDCQDMVKKAFLDETQHHNLTRLILSILHAGYPMFYFFFAYKALKSKINPWFSLVQGNFGIFARELSPKNGPIAHLSL